MTKRVSKADAIRLVTRMRRDLLAIQKDLRERDAVVLRGRAYDVLEDAHALAGLMDRLRNMQIDEAGRG